MKDQIEQEQRRYPRFLVAYDAIAALPGARLGKITNISRGGLAFRYIDFEDEDDVAASESWAVSIIHDPGFSLLDVPCKVIRDDYFPSDEHHPGSLKINTCCIQFYPLTTEQEARLDYFIENFVIGTARESC